MVKPPQPSRKTNLLSRSLALFSHHRNLVLMKSPPTSNIDLGARCQRKQIASLLLVGHAPGATVRTGCSTRVLSPNWCKSSRKFGVITKQRTSPFSLMTSLLSPSMNNCIHSVCSPRLSYRGTWPCSKRLSNKDWQNAERAEAPQVACSIVKVSAKSPSLMLI